MSYTALYYHVVFGTYRREPVLNPDIKEVVRQYVGGIIRNYKSKLLCLNYMPDHVHLLIDLSVEEPLSKVVGVVKQSLSLWLKKDDKCPEFKKWSKEYYGVSLSPTHTKEVERYILSQEEHHRTTTFDNEIGTLIGEAGLSRYPDSFYE